MTQEKREQIKSDLTNIAVFLRNANQPVYKNQLGIIQALEQAVLVNDFDSSMETRDILKKIIKTHFVPDNSQASSSAAATSEKDLEKIITKLMNDCERQIDKLSEKKLPTTGPVSKILPELPVELFYRKEGVSGFLNAAALGNLSSTSTQTYRRLQSELRLAKSEKLILHVARGEQDKANLLIQNDRDLEHDLTELLLKTCDVTDYSGRTFQNITAYEYAWWAKDKHMLQMLESHMDDTTKAFMLGRIDALERHGLTYSQHEKTITGSKHFDMTPLKTAYEEYIRIYTAWQQAHYHDAGEADVVAAWRDVGKAQRDLPVHYVNEYFRKDRSFHPLPDFNEPNLPRELTFFNYRTGKSVRLFPLALTVSSGLGVDFAFIRDAGAGEGAHMGSGALDGPGFHDLMAVSHLDVVRTNDLMQSRKNLESLPPAPGLSR